MNYSEQDYLEIIARLAIRADRAEWRAEHYRKKLDEFEAKEKAASSVTSTDGGPQQKPGYIHSIVTPEAGGVKGGPVCT